MSWASPSRMSSLTESVVARTTACSVSCIRIRGACGSRCIIKDEDFRLSFMYGNYMTLTNLTDAEMQRIVDQKLSPIYVSVHATDQKVRDILLGRPNTLPLLPRLDFLKRNDIDFYAQLVLCPGLNDGAVMEQTLKDLEPYFPRLRGITGVPVGLTRYRDHLFPLKPYDRDGARTIVEYAHKKQEEFYKRLGSRLFFLADEFYLIAELPFPEPSSYENFETREDGVGMIPRFRENMKKALRRFKRPAAPGRRALIVTGRAAENMFREDVIPEMERAGWPKPILYPITNPILWAPSQLRGAVDGAGSPRGLAVCPEGRLHCDLRLLSENRHGFVPR